MSHLDDDVTRAAEEARVGIAEVGSVGRRMDVCGVRRRVPG